MLASPLGRFRPQLIKRRRRSSRTDIDELRYTPLPVKADDASVVTTANFNNYAIIHLDRMRTAGLKFTLLLQQDIQWVRRCHALHCFHRHTFISLPSR
jgi:hypothetical protein